MGVILFAEISYNYDKNVEITRKFYSTVITAFVNSYKKTAKGDKVCLVLSSVNNNMKLLSKII